MIVIRISMLATTIVDTDDGSFVDVFDLIIKKLGAVKADVLA